jgi:hypothetical protein
MQFSAVTPMRNEIQVLVIIIVVTSLVLGFHLVTTSQEFSRANTGWNGTSEFFTLPDRHTTHDITGFSVLSGKVNATLLIIAPAGIYPDTDVTEIRRFVEAGNTLVLVSGDSAGDSLLKKLGSPVTIRPGILASINLAYGDPYIVVTRPETEHPVTRNVPSLVLNHGATLTGGTSLFGSDMMSWIDTDGNRRISGGESIGRRSVAVAWPLGTGEVVVISDPSIFTNAMLHVGDQWGNRALVDNCISLHPTLFIEQVASRTRDRGTAPGVLYLLRSGNLPKIGIVAFVLFLLALWVQRSGRGSMSRGEPGRGHSYPKNQSNSHGTGNSVDIGENRF